MEMGIRYVGQNMTKEVEDEQEIIGNTSCLNK